MGEIKLTVSQQAVVDNRGGSLLVSAAAGSGKTKVLVDRLLNRLCDPEAPCNLDDFLIITYTKAAASELRLKIAQALGARIAEKPENRHLQRQMNRLYLTEVSTVHAFCSNLLRSYAHHLDLAADFRVAEETESKILQEKVLDHLLEEGYRSADAGFLAMVETFGYGRDDRRLADAVFMAYKEMRCRPDMDRWLNENLAALDISQYDDAAQTPWGAYILQEFHNFLQMQIGYLQSAVAEMELYPNIEKGLRNTFEENIRQLQALNDCVGWDEILQNKVESFGRAVVRKPEDAAVKDRIAKVRTRCWSELKTWQSFFFADSDSVLDDLRQVSAGAQELLRFTKSFDRAYLAEKKKRKLMDFSDLEHEAIRLLTDRYTGKPTAVAKEISKKYVEILVDEYQDSNGVQDLIFEAVSRDGKNRFMVGDVKQSIYRFRLADPSIFLRKYEAFPDYSESVDGLPRKILLSENFRSRPEILSACNDVFRLVMRKRVGDLDYGDREALRPGKMFPALQESAVELHCLTSSTTDGAMDKTEMEADYAASRIRQMLDKKAFITEGDSLRPVQAGDIVILMRSLSGNASVYLDALGRYGIPAVCERGGNLLDTTEIQVLVAILQVLDNPHQDIPLLTALASPVFGYSPDELAAPRTKNRNLDLFDALCSEPERFGSFISVIADLREEMKWLDLQSLLQTVIEKTGIRTVFSAMDDGVRRERNIMAFSSFVQSFSQNGIKRLSHLLWYISDLNQNGGQIPIPKSASENCVSIMSIHSSKGLEFPVVFLCDLSRKFNLTDMQDAVLVDNDLSVGCNRIDHTRFVRYPTLAKKAIVRKKTAETISEELRILYVAMTRAKDRLIMTYYSKSLLSELDKINSQLTMPLTDDLCASAKSPGHWILMAALCRTEAGALLNLVGGNHVSSVQEHPWKIVFSDLADKIGEASVQRPQNNARIEQDHFSDLSLLQYSYPYSDEAQFPAKVTATMLKGRLQDQEAANEAELLFTSAGKQLRKPNFLRQQLTPAEKGTATHLFLQFADYQNCSDAVSIVKERERLVELSFLRREQADAVQLDAVVDFFCSSVGQWLLRQKQIKREFKFSILMNVSAFDPKISGEETMLQGVVDCFVIEPDGITIFDYKTDSITGDLQAKVSTYLPQVGLYSKALERIFGLPIKKRFLHFFSVGKTVEI